MESRRIKTRRSQTKKAGRVAFKASRGSRSASSGPRKPTTPEVAEKSGKPLKGLDTAIMQSLAHSAVMWCDHEGGTILDKDSHPFAASLEMENRLDPKEQKKRASMIEEMIKSYPRKDDKRTVEEIARDSGTRIDLKTKNKIEARFRYMTSPYSNGNLSVNVWCDGTHVLSAYDNPGPVYQYPSDKITVTVYEPGPWEEFLLAKNYHKNKR